MTNGSATMSASGSWPDSLALALTGLLLFAFVVLAVRESRRIRDVDGFLFARREVKGLLFQHTLIAGGTSLATVLIFFLSTGRIYGPVLFVNLVSFVLGQYLFFKFAARGKVDLTAFRNLAHFVVDRTGSKLLGVLVSVITVTSFFGILFIEVLIGTEIFRYFVDVPNAHLWGFGVVTLVTLLYVGLGGFAAVVESDRWQLYLMIVAVIALIAFGFFGMMLGNDNWSFTKATEITASRAQLVTLIINAVLINLTLPLCQISSWQRLAGAGNWKVVAKHYRPALAKMLFLWLGFVLFALILNGAGTVLQVEGMPKDGSVPPPPLVVGLFDVLKSPGGLAAFVVFPLAFVGLVAAQISTTDTVAMALCLELVGSKTRNKLAQWTWAKQRLFFGIFILLLFVMLGIGFAVFYTAARQNFVHLVFVLFGQLVVLFPLICWLLCSSQIRSTPLSTSIIFVGTLIAFVTVWAISIVAMVDNTLALTQFASVIGLTISGVCVITAVMLTRRNVLD